MWLIQKISDFARLGWEAIKDTAWGFNPAHLANAYFEGDALTRLLTGVLAIAALLVAIIGIPHVLVNAFYLFRDLKASRVRPWSQAFIERQNLAQIAYLQTLSSAEAEALGERGAFTDADTQAVSELLKGIREKDRHWLERFENLWSSDVRHEIRTLPEALLHFFFSFASMTNSAVLYSRVWNVWFALRTFFPLFHPILFLTVLLYPAFFGTATARFKLETLPSKWNGGLRAFWKLIPMIIFQAKEYKELREFEKKLIPGEALLHELCLLEAESWHARRMGLYRLSYLHSVDRFHERVMEHWLSQKNFNPSLTADEAAGIVRLVRNDYTPRYQVNVVSDFFRWLKYSVARTISPASCRQIEIIQVTGLQMGNAKAMARAVRSMLASNLVDKPLEILFIFICYAGITEGILRPLQPEIFSSDSWFYLSRYVFLNGFVYSVIAGIFSDTWLKIQQDTMNEGRFEDAPAGENVSRSFFGWQFHQTFTNPGNTWWHNQKFTVLHYILPTLKATFVTALIVNFITLGRLDLDSFVANSLVLIFLPFTGLSWKLEQGFELASAWVVRDVPSRLRPHPMVQKYALSAIARRRIAFNIYYKIWENITWNFLAAFMNMNTVMFGTRSFSRLVFFGFTPTELVANTVRSLQATATGVFVYFTWPLVMIDSLLTHGYNDGTKLGDRGWMD